MELEKCNLRNEIMRINDAIIEEEGKLCSDERGRYGR